LDDSSDASGMKKQVVCRKVGYRSMLWKGFFYKTAPHRSAIPHHTVMSCPWVHMLGEQTGILCIYFYTP